MLRVTRQSEQVLTHGGLPPDYGAGKLRVTRQSEQLLVPATAAVYAPDHAAGKLRVTRQSMQVLMSVRHILTASITFSVDATSEVLQLGLAKAATADLSPLLAAATVLVVRPCCATSSLTLGASASGFAVRPISASTSIAFSAQANGHTDKEKSLSVQLDFSVNCYVNLEGEAPLDLSVAADLSGNWIRGAATALAAEVDVDRQLLAVRTGKPTLTFAASVAYVGPHAAAASASLGLQASARICQTYVVNAGSTLSLSSGTEAHGTQHLSAASGLSFNAMAEKGIFVRSVIAELDLQATANTSHCLTANSHLDLSGTAEQGQIRVHADAHLTFTAVARTNPLWYTPSVAIAFTPSVKSNIHMLTASSQLTLSAGISAWYPKHLDALASFDTVEYVFNEGTNFLDAVHTGLSVEITTDNTIAPQTPTTTVPADAILELDAVVDAICLRGRGVAAALVLETSLLFTVSGGGYTRQYHPFVGTGAAGLPTPPPATLDAPIDGITAPFQFIYPATGVASDSVTLRAPNFGNKDRLSFNRILRETRGGTLIVFADPIWPKIQTLVLTFSALRQAETSDLLTFLSDHVGEEVGLLDWERRYWRGVITTPEAAAIEDGFDSFTVSLEFEGELDMTAGNFVRFSWSADAEL